MVTSEIPKMTKVCQFFFLKKYLLRFGNIWKLQNLILNKINYMECSQLKCINLKKSTFGECPVHTDCLAHIRFSMDFDLRSISIHIIFFRYHIQIIIVNLEIDIFEKYYPRCTQKVKITLLLGGIYLIQEKNNSISLYELRVVEKHL